MTPQEAKEGKHLYRVNEGQVTALLTTIRPFINDHEGREGDSTQGTMIIKKFHRGLASYVWQRCVRLQKLG